jgi:hypothetical protein
VTLAAVFSNQSTVGDRAVAWLALFDEPRVAGDAFRDAKMLAPLSQPVDMGVACLARSTVTGVPATGRSGG